jgi:hypothetical protein
MSKRGRSVRVGKNAFVAAAVLAVSPALIGQAGAKTAAGKMSPVCAPIVFEGQVRAGEGYEHVFTKGLRFYLEPLRSGWIVRVLSTSEPRGPHDYAELATPPYRSESPLLISTDWAFRAQDAIAWNPRRFRYAADHATFAALAAMYPGVMANDMKSESQVAKMVAAQPEVVLRILDARIAPGIADQWRVAGMVAQHLAETPFSIDSAAKPSPLGKIEELHFRVELALPGAKSGAGTNKKSACPVPTT